MPDQQTKPSTSAPATQTELRRDDDFISRYANNFQLESSAFDLKLIFGLLNQSTSKVFVEQHTAINLSWPEVKLLLFFLQLHLAAHERDNGKVKIPLDALPPEPPAEPPPPYDNPKGREAYDLIRKMRADFLARLTEA